MAEVGKLSSTKIMTYEGCNMAYFLKYVAREKVPLNPRPVFGRVMHYMLERYYKVNYKSAESFSKFFKYYWISTIAGEFLSKSQKRELKIEEHRYFARDKDTQKREEKILRVGSHINLSFADDVPGIVFGYMNLGSNILSRFFIKHDGRIPPVAVEKSFGVKKDEPLSINGHLVRGVFDRIDRVRDELSFTDYKTDKSSPQEDSFYLHRNPQFTLYSYVFRKIYGAQESAIYFYHLRDLARYETHRNEKDYDYLKGLLDKVANGIEKDLFVPFYGFHCKFCDYRAPCEKYNIPYRGGPRIDLEGRIRGAKSFDDWDIEIPNWLENQIEEI
ncbi:MAG: PD-(D/E)XK nuclease family protein [archaeon]